MQTLYNVGDKIFIPLEGYVRAIEITEKGETYSIEIDLLFQSDPFIMNRFIMSKEDMIKSNIRQG